MHVMGQDEEYSALSLVGKSHEFNRPDGSDQMHGEEAPGWWRLITQQYVAGTKMKS